MVDLQRAAGRSYKDASFPSVRRAPKQRLAQAKSMECHCAESLDAGRALSSIIHRAHAGFDKASQVSAPSLKYTWWDTGVNTQIALHSFVGGWFEYLAFASAVSCTRRTQCARSN